MGPVVQAKKRVALNPNGYTKGQIVPYGEGFRVFDGTQLKQICAATDCKRPAIYQGECKSHSEHWRCKYSESRCTSIRTVGDYCVGHRNNEYHARGRH